MLFNEYKVINRFSTFPETRQQVSNQNLQSLEEETKLESLNRQSLIDILSKMSSYYAKTSLSGSPTLMAHLHEVK